MEVRGNNYNKKKDNKPTLNDKKKYSLKERISLYIALIKVIVVSVPISQLI